MSDVETTVQLEEAEASRGKIPAELSFEEVIKNNTLPPCSLNDFMDYLFYVEHNAESLQFFLWYCDYVQRWSNLLPRQKALSPMWDPEKATEPSSRFIRYSHKRATSEKMNKIISIMEMDQQREVNEDDTNGHGRNQSSSSANYSRPRTSSSTSTIMSPVDVKEDWQPFTIQPFRDEVTRIVRHYITESSPRQLSLTTQDRDTILHAISHTTHPSALMPAFIVSEASLKARSHPKFIRWSLSNANTPRLHSLRCLGLSLALLGLALDIFLILSRLNNYLRLLPVLFWWPGLAVLLAASGHGGMCILLHFRNVRHVRPWEMQVPEGDDDLDKARPDFKRQHARKDTAASNFSTLSSRGSDPLRKASLQTFGPKNEPDVEAWRELYAAKSLYGRVFEESVPVQNQKLQVMQDRAVFMAVVWSALVASCLAVGSVFVPGGNLFL